MGVVVHGVEAKGGGGDYGVVGDGCDALRAHCCCWCCDDAMILWVSRLFVVLASGAHVHVEQL